MMNKQWQQLVTAIQKNRLPHALLFVSESPKTILPFAEDFMQLLLCEHNKTGKTCNVCRSCFLFKSATHPNIIRLQTAEEKETIKVDQIRACVQALQNTAVIGHRKIVLISLAEQMNTAASNALLKTLEEPIGETIFILITQRIHSLLATIRSRCQKIYFPSSMIIDISEEFTKKLDLVYTKETSIPDFSSWCLKQYALKKSLSFIFQWLFITAKKNQQNKLSNEKIFHCYDLLLATEKTLLENVHLNEQLVLENLLIEMSKK